MNQLARAIRIAAEAHETQLDKAGEPYVLHVVRVVLGCQTPDAQTVAALHDVVEDTDWTFARLRDEGFDEAILAAVDAMTRREGEEYLDFVRRAMRNPLARAVKRADLLDNLNMTRIAAPSARDQERYQRYAQALALLDAAGAGAEVTP